MSRSESTTRTELSYAPPATQRSRKTNKMAVWSLILSIVWLGGLGSLAGIALGALARRRIAETGERGAGLAVGGIVIGVITLVFAIAYWLLIARHMGVTGGGHHGSGGGGGYGY